MLDACVRWCVRHPCDTRDDTTEVVITGQLASVSSFLDTSQLQIIVVWRVAIGKSLIIGL